MAKITVIGDAVVVTSAMKLEDIKMVQKYRPAALILKGGEDGKEPIFKIGVGTPGNINKYGAEFGSATHDDEKLATITLGMKLEGAETQEEVKEVIADTIGASLAHLNALEAVMPGVIEEIKAERAAIMESISMQ